MANQTEIKSEKILIKDIFSTMWFRVPEYQRPYVWTRDEVTELLDDLVYASTEKPENEYFLGSFVFQAKKANSEGQEFDENDLLDGQQRMTTLLMLFACIRDLSADEEAKKDCQNSIYQKGSQYRNIPERNRLVFSIRESVQDFVDKFIKAEGGTDNVTGLKSIAEHSDDTSLQNMSNAILEIRSYFQDSDRKISLESLLTFLLNKVLLIYVSTQDLDDAFRLFTILNDRGVPLRNSDILKSMNLGALRNELEKVRYAKLWENAESELGDDFDRFLNHLRTILVKEKARMNLLQEFEEKIYNPKEKDKTTGEKKAALLNKGKDTFEFLEKYLNHFSVLCGGKNYDETGNSFEFDNLIRVMEVGLPSSDWLPPLLKYFDKFSYTSILPFLVKLDNKFSGDWIAQYTPTERLENMNRILRCIDLYPTPNELLGDTCFEIDAIRFGYAIDGPVYGKKFAKYLLLKLDYLFQDHSHRMSFESLSVEHILPQNPNKDSQWCRDFTETELLSWVHKLSNLVLISGKKNSAQGRADFIIKKKKYFSGRITTCPNSLRILQENEAWTPKELKQNRQLVNSKIGKYYGVSNLDILLEL